MSLLVLVIEYSISLIIKICINQNSFKRAANGHLLVVFASRKLSERSWRTTEPAL